MKIWLRASLPVRTMIKGICYEIGPDKVAGGPRQMNLEARRLDSGKAIKLAELPASWFRDEYDRHAWFESWPNTPARKLADSLLFQDLAVLEPGIGWTYRYEKSMPWSGIALGCEYHDGNGWHKKTEEKAPPMQLSGYLIRY